MRHDLVGNHAPQVHGLLSDFIFWGPGGGGAEQES